MSLLTDITNPDTSAHALGEMGEHAHYKNRISRWGNQTDSQIVGDAIQETETWQPLYLPKEETSYFYMTGGTNNKAEIAPMTLDFSLPWEIEIDQNPSWALSYTYLLSSVNTSHYIRYEVSGAISLRTGSGSPSSGVNLASWSTIPNAAGRNILRFVWNGSSSVTLYVNGVSQGAKGISAPSTMLLENIGSWSNDTSCFNGRMYSVRHFIDGTITTDINFKDRAHGTTSFVCPTGQTVTVVESGSNPATIIASSVIRMDGVDDLLQCLYDTPDSYGKIFFFVGAQLADPNTSTRLLSWQNASDASDAASTTSMIISYLPAQKPTSYMDGTGEMQAGSAITMNKPFSHEVDILASNVSYSYRNGVISPVSNVDHASVAADILNIGAGQVDATPSFHRHAAIDIRAILEFTDPGTDELREQLRVGVNSLYHTY